MRAWMMTLLKCSEAGRRLSRRRRAAARSSLGAIAVPSGLLSSTLLAGRATARPKLLKTSRRPTPPLTVCGRPASRPPSPHAEAEAADALRSNCTTCAGPSGGTVREMGVWDGRVGRACGTGMWDGHVGRA